MKWLRPTAVELDIPPQDVARKDKDLNIRSGLCLWLRGQDSNLRYPH